MATSAALVSDRPAARAGRAGGDDLPPPPNLPRITLVIVRFMAMAICWVRMVPEAPTIMPATISAWFSRGDARRGRGQAGEGVEQEMTTGMSAPIGRTSMMPKMPAATSSVIM